MKKHLQKMTATKKALLTLALIAGTSSAFAGPHRHTDFARVTDVQPIYKTVSHRIPVEQCRIERVKTNSHHSRRHAAAGTIIGTVIGANIGNEVSHNRRVGTVAGAIIGASIGNDIARKHDRRHHRGDYHDVERCETRYESRSEEKLVGYRVRYNYHGGEYHTRMDRHPGRRIKVVVSVKPV